MCRKKVYFDGALPTQKRDVRRERLEAGRRRMEGFRVLHAGGFKGSSTSTSTAGAGAGKEIGIASLFGNDGNKTPEKFNGLPENPFMTPSTIEDLKNYWTWGRVRREIGMEELGEGKGDSELAFADIVEVVPNEADIYCAEVARLSTDGPVAVLTSDSDLLVHDLGGWGSVVFYDSLELADGGIVKGMELHPAAIADRLGVVSIPRFAFEMKYDRGVSKGEAIRRAKDSSGRVEESASFRSFMEEYEPLPAGDEHTRPGIYNPRLGELVAQYDFSRLCGKDDSEEGYHVYLPILIEDHTRRSAWVDGTHIRIIAYSLLYLTSSSSASHQTKILEFSRRGPRIPPSSLPLLTSTADLIREIKPLLTAIQKTQSLVPTAKEPLKFWTIFALLEIYTSDAPNGNVPSLKETINFLTLGSTNPTKMFWEDVHRNARVLAVLYSVKFLKEVIDIITPRDEWYHVGMVSGWLGSMPAGRELFCDKRGREEVFKGEGTVDVVKRLMGLVNREVPDGGEVEEGWVGGGGKGKGRKRVWRRSGPGGNGSEKDGKKKGKKGGGNMFDVLSGM